MQNSLKSGLHVPKLGWMWSRAHRELRCSSGVGEQHKDLWFLGVPCVGLPFTTITIIFVSSSYRFLLKIMGSLHKSIMVLVAEGNLERASWRAGGMIAGLCSCWDGCLGDLLEGPQEFPMRWSNFQYSNSI